MSEDRTKYEAALDLGAIKTKWASLAKQDWDIIVSYANVFIRDLVNEVEKLRTSEQNDSFQLAKHKVAGILASWNWGISNQAWQEVRDELPKILEAIRNYKQGE